MYATTILIWARYAASTSSAADLKGLTAIPPTQVIYIYIYIDWLIGLFISIILIMIIFENLENIKEWI